MYKILICDDEKIVLDSLQFIINKNFSDDCVLEFARTGRIAVELAEEFRPDLILTDIQMPGINGIDAIKEIQKRNDKTLFIVMTAFDKFEYAKESANLGVFRFLNKPVNQNVVVDTIKEALRIVDQNREQRSYDLEIKEKLENVVPIIENGYIYSLLLESDNTNELEQYQDIFDKKLQYGSMMVIEWGDLREGYHLSNSIGASIKAVSFHRELREYIKEFVEGYVGAIAANKIMVYMPREQANMEYDERIRMIETARALVRKLMSRIDYDFRVGIGSVKEQENAKESYREALKALKCEKGKVVHVEDVVSKQDAESEYLVEEEGQLLGAIKAGKVKETLELAIRLMDTMQEQELKAWLLSVAQESVGDGQWSKKTQTNQLVVKALEYMKESYHQNLTLEDISRIVNVSPYYFSKVFKEEMGETFIDYLTNLRMEAAKEQLKDRSLSIKEICISVGYSDPNYFSRIFRKVEGITPTEYREHMGKESK